MFVPEPLRFNTCFLTVAHVQKSCVMHKYMALNVTEQMNECVQHSTFAKGLQHVKDVMKHTIIHASLPHVHNRCL